MPAVPVPDAESLRQKALHASWRRDRSLARRRLWLRWLLWASVRYLMPAMLVFGLGAWLWLGVLRGMGHPLDRVASFLEPGASPAPAARPPSAAVADPTPALPPSDLAEPRFSPEGEELPVPLRLRFEPRWAASANSSITASVSAAADSFTTSQPHLKPENWLHSKEP